MKNIQLAIFILIFAFTFVLRSHNYDRTPGPGHLDEMLYAWSGLYLIETGTPVSWSTLDYPKSAEVFRGKISYRGGDPSAFVTLYKPWLDEPPLFSLISGGSAHFFGASRTEFVPSSFTRFPVIFISTLTSLLIFVIVRKISSFKLALLSLVIYSTSPVMVFGSRTAMPENLISLLLMLTVFLLLKYKETKMDIFLLFIPVLAGLAGLAKPTGYFIFPLSLFMFFYINKFDLKNNLRILTKKAILLAVLFIPFVVAYFWWGNNLNPEIFKTIFSIQSMRPAGFNSFAWFLVSPSFGTTETIDAIYIFSVLSTFFYLFKLNLKSKYSFLLLPFLYWLLVVMITGGENDLLAWYRYPLFPFISIFGALGIIRLIKKANIFTSFILILTMMGNRIFLVNAFKPNLSTQNFRFLLSFLLAPSVISIFVKTKIVDKISRTVLVTVLVIGFWMNSVYIYNAFEIACESKTCTLVESTWLSRLHFPLIWRFFTLK